MLTRDETLVLCTSQPNLLLSLKSWNSN